MYGMRAKDSANGPAFMPPGRKRHRPRQPGGGELVPRWPARPPVRYVGGHVPVVLALYEGSERGQQPALALIMPGARRTETIVSVLSHVRGLAPGRWRQACRKEGMMPYTS